MATPDETTAAETAAILRVEEQLEKDEQEEWEYEYSTTETEVLLISIYALTIHNLTVARPTT
jgi:hypothetical protein